MTLLTPLDYETAANYTLIIRASDTGEHARHADFTLHVQVDDVNDNSPKFAKDVIAFDVPETLAIGKTWKSTNPAWFFSPSLTQMAKPQCDHSITFSRVESLK